MADTKATDQSRSAVDAAAVTVTTTFSNPTRAIYLGTGGNLPVVFESGTKVTLTGAAAGYHPLQIIAIETGSMTAANVVALF
jgi:hypothetical protein